MHPNIHTDFILSSITVILNDAVSASSGIGAGIQTFPLCDYVMQSIFLKMTGFQEQKMKCICWEMATYDYEYRYGFIKSNLGECSNYDDKKKVYQDLIKQIEKCGLSFDDFKIDRKAILKSSYEEIYKTFSNTNLSIWAQQDFFNFMITSKEIKHTHFLNERKTLISDANLIKIYNDHLYKHRNRVAHNTSSYQQNLPTLKTLISKDYKYNNYFIYFYILVLIDKLFIELYKKYLSQIADRDN